MHLPDLFSQNGDLINLLPDQGEVYYFDKIINRSLADEYYNDLFNNITWKNDEAIIYGKHYVTKRKVAWYGDAPYPYTYSNTTKEALPWTPTLVKIKNLVEKKTKESYNSCLLNLYHTGEEGMAWHSDDEKSLQANAGIASFSLGAVRKFAFKHKTTKVKIDLILEHGSLLLMTGETQRHWHHRLPPTKKVKTPRINLTFRKMDPDGLIR